MKRPPEMTPLYKVAWALGWGIQYEVAEHNWVGARSDARIIRNYLLSYASKAEREIILSAARKGCQQARPHHTKPIAVDKEAVS